MEQTNYEKLILQQPTEDEARQIWDRWEPTEFLLYRSVNYAEPITELKRSGVECICTACRQRAIWPKIPRDGCGRLGYGAPFGVMLPEGARIDSQKATCPECGAAVMMAHVGSFRGVIGNYSHWCTVGRFEDKLVIYCWVAQRDVCKDATCLTSIKPFEAYVVESRKVVRLKAYHKCMSSFRLTEEWEQVKICHDTLGCVGSADMLPWDPAILEGTVVENSKLDLYMQQDGDLYPVSYLRLFLKHPQVENLLTSGAGHFLVRQIASEMSTYYSSAGRGIPKLESVNWKEARPTKMLGLNKDELSWFVRQKWTYKELDLYKKLREQGRVKLPDDVDLLRKTSAWEANRLIEEGYPVRRCIRYCVKQEESVSYLMDYWSMARAEGVDLNDESLRFPKDLTRQHDRMVRLRNERQVRRNEEIRRQEMEKRRAGFERQLKKWSRLNFSAGGILIRCCQTEEELVAEGKALSHCVGNYAASVSTGGSVIFFIRREDKPDKSWFTLELDPNDCHVRQNRGKKNCDPPQEVVSFVALWTNTKIKKKESAA